MKMILAIFILLISLSARSEEPTCNETEIKERVLAFFYGLNYQTEGKIRIQNLKIGDPLAQPNADNPSAKS